MVAGLLEEVVWTANNQAQSCGGGSFAWWTSALRGLQRGGPKELGNTCIHREYALHQSLDLSAMNVWT